MRHIRLAVCLSMLAATLGIMGGPPAVQAVALVPAESGSAPQRHVESWRQLPADLGRAIHLSIPGTAPTTFQTRLTGGPAVQDRARFGSAVALDATGTIALVGASFATGGKGKRTGAAYVFVRGGSTWTLQARLTPGRSGERGAGFGLAVALDASGTTAIVGAPQATLEQLRNAGAAYVFTRHGSTWTRQARLTAGTSTQGDVGFGSTVAVDGVGSTAIIGVSGEMVESSDFAGAAYVFTRGRNTWTLQAHLTAGSTVQPMALFGTSVALDRTGTIAVITASEETVGKVNTAGAAYVFTRHGSTWTRQARLTAGSSARGGASFGSSVVLDGAADTALIGAGNEKIGQLINAGAAYVFTRHGKTWTRQARLTAESNIGNQANFGQSVAIDRAGVTALIGAPLEELATASTADSNRLVPGAAYVFARTGSVWTHQARLTTGSSTTVTCDQSQSCFAWFGRSVALDSAGSVALIGAGNETVGWHAGAGAAYVFTSSGTG